MEQGCQVERLQVRERTNIRIEMCNEGKYLEYEDRGGRQGGVEKTRWSCLRSMTCIRGLFVGCCCCFVW